MRDISQYFPYKDVRDQQTQAINFALDAFLDQGKAFCVIEAGTGVGKSAIGLTIAKYLAAHDTPPVDLWDNGAFFLTTQKILQDQYVEDFGASDSMCSIKSSTNYQCKHYKKQSCSESMQMLKAADKSSRFFKTCTTSCHYKQDKKKYMESTLGLTNFSYFMTDNAFNAKSKPRNLLVIDEAHNIETEISKFVEVTISERFSSHVLGLLWPSATTHHQVVTWLKETYLPKCVSKIEHIEKTLEKFKGLEAKIKEISNLAKEFELLKSHTQKVQKFLEIQDPDNWVFEEIPAQGQKMRSYSFKPIDISEYARENLFRMGRRVLMLSATILDKEAFCGSLGLNVDDVSFVSIPTPFPAENRPVFFFPGGNMGADHIEQSLPKLLQMVKKILGEHPKEKGIIHCHTYRIANYLKTNLRSDRILIHDSNDRDKILQDHMSSSKPTVLLSPSMTEGVDLKGDASRFQVICKIPYPSLGDKIVRKRMNRWKWWYPLQTSKTIIQAIGRSVRSSDDFAVTYILDSDWERFFSRNENMFPQSFKDSIVRQ